MRSRPDRREPRAVLTAVKARPQRRERGGEASATADLDGPCARRIGTLQVGTKERPPRHEQRNK
jgi:hypothetical protein